MLDGRNATQAHCRQYSKLTPTVGRGESMYAEGLDAYAQCTLIELIQPGFAVCAVDNTEQDPAAHGQTMHASIAEN
jgi:hypothetical protein